MKIKKRRLKEPVVFEGEGIHTGEYSKIELIPNDEGIIIEKGDEEIVLTPSKVDTKNATNIRAGGIEFLTAEHLFATLYSLSLFDVRVRIIEGREVPIYDGSSKLFFEKLKPLTFESDEIESFHFDDTILITEGNSKISYEPLEDSLLIDYEIFYDHPVIGRMRGEFNVSIDTFFNEIAPARTFGFFKDYEKLLKFNLAGGASAENTVILGEKEVINPPLRFKDEFLRHKVLDLLGDLYTISLPISGKIKVKYGGHHLHNLLAREIYSRLLEFLNSNGNKEK